MDLYSQKSHSYPQKALTIFIELLLVILSAYFMFGGGDAWFANYINFDLAATVPTRRLVILLFSIAIFLRMTFMMFYLMKRRMPWSETLTIPGAFAIYYVGFALLVLPNQSVLNAFDYFGIAIFIWGCYLNTASEYQRHIFKLNPNNKGKLYTTGLFAQSMHINFFGDILWVFGYAIIAGNLYGYSIPILISGFFAFVNVPMLDNYLRGRYKEDFVNYEVKTKKLIPYIW